MPYNRESAADRDKVVKRLRRYWPKGAPDRAVDQFIEVFNGVYGATHDEGRALAAAYGTVQRRVGEDLDHAAMPAAVATLGRTLAVALSLGALRKLEQVLAECDCGQKHEKALKAVRLAIRLALFKFDRKESKLQHAGMEGGYERKKAGVNVAWAWDMAATQIYSQGDRVFLAVREMLQNSRDARATDIQIEWIPDPPSSVGPKTGTLIFTDNGKGMTQEVVETKFMELGGSMKEDGALGGFGAAKAAILTASVTKWSWDLRTRNVHARSIAGGDYAITTTPDTFPGTKITLYQVKDEVMTSPIGSGSPVDRIRALMSTSDLRGIRVTINGEAVTPYFAGRRGKPEEDFEAFDWGRFAVDIKSYKRASGEGGAIIVRVKGLAQFAEPEPYGQKFQRDYVLDFEIPPDIVPQSEVYPFKAGRDAFRYGGPSWYSFKRLVDLITARAGEKTEIGGYEEIAPDSTDPREQKAEAQFAKTIDSVMGGKGFNELLAELNDTAREFAAELGEAMGGSTGGIEIVVGESPRPGGGMEYTPSPFDDLVQLVGAAGSPSEQVQILAEWARERLADEDVYDFNSASRYLANADGNAVDLERFVEGVQRAVKRASPHTSPLLVASFVSRIIDQIEALVAPAYKEEVKKKKRKGELNPFGGAAVIFFSREEYGQERAEQFRKDARKYMKHLVWWDFTVRMVTQALHAGGSMDAAVKPGVGFVLDDKLLGLCRKDGQYVMVNPEPLARVIEQFKDRPFIPATFIHGVACHEIAHAQQIIKNSNSNHNEYWSIKREAFAEATLFLLPVIEEIGAKLFKMKRRRRRKEQAVDEVALDKITKLEAALAEARQKETELSNDVAYWRDAWNTERDAVWSSRQDAYKTARADADAELQPFRVALDNVAKRLEDALRLEEFRQWVQVNPQLLTEHGISEETFEELLSTPGAMYEILQRAQLNHAQLSVDPTLFPEAQEAYHTACGCVESWAKPYHEKKEPQHAGCPGCGGTCGGTTADDDDERQHAACSCTARTEHAAARVKCPPVTRSRVTVGADGKIYNRDGSTSGPTRRRTPEQEKRWERVADGAEDILRKHKIQLGRTLGCGSYACAYEVVGKKSVVAKLTGDPADAGAWMQVLKRTKGKPWPKGLVRTHCVEALPLIKGKQFFLMLQDKVTQPIRDYTAGADFINDDDVRMAFLDGNTKYLLATAKEFGANPKWVKPLADTIRWLQQNKIDWHDLHSGNVMLKGSVPVIIDLGHGTVPKAKVPVMKHAALRTESHAGARINGCPATDGAVLVEGPGTVSRSPGEVSWRQQRSSTSWSELVEQAQKQLAYHGIILGEPLGCGKYACAFEADGVPGIVKITSDGADAAAWQRVLEEKKTPPGLAKTYCVEALDLGEDHPPVFIIVQEQLEPLFADEETLINIPVYRAVQNYDTWLDLDHVQRELRQWIEELPDEFVTADVGLTPEELEEARDALHARLGVILDATHWLRVRGVEWTDVHAGNVMMDSVGNLKIVDLGHGRVSLTTIPLLAAPPTTEHAAMRLTGRAPYQDHIVVYTGEDLQALMDSDDPAGLIDQADTLIANSEWPGFNQLLALAVDESTTDEDGEPIGPAGHRVAGIISDDGTGELLFLVDEEYQGQRIGRLMVKGLLPEVDEATKEEVISGDWSPPYSAIAGSEAGAAFLHSLPNEFGWKAYALIEWSGYDEDLELWREQQEEEEHAGSRHAGARIDVLRDMAIKQLQKAEPGSSAQDIWEDLHPNFREGVEDEARRRGVTALDVVRQVAHAGMSTGGLTGAPREDRVEGRWYEGFPEAEDEDNDDLIADLLGG